MTAPNSAHCSRVETSALTSGCHSTSLPNSHVVPRAKFYNSPALGVREPCSRLFTKSASNQNHLGSPASLVTCAQGEYISPTLRSFPLRCTVLRQPHLCHRCHPDSAVCARRISTPASHPIRMFKLLFLARHSSLATSWSSRRMRQIPVLPHANHPKKKAHKRTKSRRPARRKPDLRCRNHAR